VAFRRLSRPDTRYTDLRHGVERTGHVENPLRVPWDAFGDHDSSAAFLANFVDVCAALSNDNRGVLSDDETPHLDVRGCRSGARSR